MKRTNSFEIVGIGDFDEYPAKAEEVEFEPMTKDRIPLVKKQVQRGTPSEYAWMDKDGKVYANNDVWWDIKGKLVQKVERTDKVTAFKYVEAKDIKPLSMDTSFLEPRNDTTRNKLSELIKDGKALKFSYKKSSVGLKWTTGMLFEEDGEFVLLTGRGDRKKALEMFKGNKKNSKKGKAMPGEVVVSSADEVAPDLD